MEKKYEYMIEMQRPQFAEYPPMPVKDRAAQFSSFAALRGYDDAVKDTAAGFESKLLESEKGMPVEEI